MADRRQRLHTLHSGQLLPPKQTRAAIRRVEANLKDLARVVDDCEREAEKRTIEHLDCGTLPRRGQSYLVRAASSFDEYCHFW
jgi:hypothetical protein